MKKFISNRYVWYFFGILMLLLIWEIFSLCVGEKVLILPGPYETIQEMTKILSKNYVYQCIGSSVFRMLIGFSFSLVLALVLGILAGNFPHFKEMMTPFMTLLKAIPTASLVFLFLVLVGARGAPVMMVVLISFPILYEAVVGGIEGVPKEVNDALRVDGNRWWKKLFDIQLPLAVPAILIGISSSFGLSFKIEIMAEILTGDTKNGIGSAIFAAQKNDPTNMLPIFAYSLIAVLIILIVSLLCKILKNWMEKREDNK